MAPIYSEMLGYRTQYPADLFEPDPFGLKARRG